MRSGYEKDGKEVDECKINGIYKNGQCVNTKGSYKCVCDQGFDLDESGTECVNIDELISKGIYGPGICVNERSGFRCDFQRGYRNHMMIEMCVGESIF